MGAATQNRTNSFAREDACEGEAHGCWAVKPRTSGGCRDGFFLRDVLLISRAAFDTLERAKHWTAFHVAQTITLLFLVCATWSAVQCFGLCSFKRANYIVCATWNAVQCFALSSVVYMMVMYMQLNTHMSPPGLLVYSNKRRACTFVGSPMTLRPSTLVAL